MKTLFLLLPFALAAQLSAATAPAPRWNILFVFADDWGRHAKAYAAIDRAPSINDVLVTPHMDRIAREGVLFRHAYTSAPQCTPSRSALFSGRHFFNTGRASIQAGVWDEATPVFPLQLRDAGYSIGKSYKVWSPGIPRDAPFGGQRYAYEKSGNAANNYSEQVTRRVASGSSLAQARDEILQQVRGNFDAFLAARTPGAPWLYYFGPTNTHRAWVQGSGKALWGIDPEKLKGRMPAYLPDAPEVREDLADYFGEVQALDAYVGALLERLEAIGELDRTLIVLSGDHGMPGFPSGKFTLYDNGAAVPLLMRIPGGKPGRVVDDFVCLPELSPTFLEIAGVKPPEGLYGTSLLPVLQSERSGQVDARRTAVITGRERHVGNSREGNLPAPMRALRTKDFLYILNFKPDRMPTGDAKAALNPESLASGALASDTFIGFTDMDAGPTKAWLVAHRNDGASGPWHFDRAFGKRPAEQLFDLRQDPDEVKDVASLPEYAKTKAELHQLLLDRLTAAHDPRVTGDGQTFERAPFTDPDPGTN